MKKDRSSILKSLPSNIAYNFNLINKWLILVLLISSCKDKTAQECITINKIANETTTETLLEYQIDCEIRNNDPRLEDENILYVTAETLPNRDGKHFDTIKLNDNRFYNGSVIIPTIENKDSLVIGLLFYESDTAKLVHAVYDKIKINHGGTTNYNKIISGKDLWDKPPCTLFTTVNRSLDLENDFQGFSCIVGSPGDCTHISIDTRGGIETFCEDLIEYQLGWKMLYESNISSTPCGEIYTRIQ